MQANLYGGLSEAALQRAREIANFADLRLTAPRAGSSTAVTTSATMPKRRANTRLPMPGTVITRDYKGRKLEVQVLDAGFEFEGQRYKSLSAVAKAATGAHWNGYHFFGLTQESTS
jgi:hypothetical protein